MRAVVIYWTATGNTAKAARAIAEGLEEEEAGVKLLPLDEAQDVDWYAHDLVVLGFPSYRWSPPKPVDNYLQARFKAYKAEGRVKVGAPRRAGKHALIFCTYSGPHTGVNEAVPAGKYAGQFFEHLGFEVLDEWYVVGEFHGRGEYSTRGRLGDIRGRPTADDLRGLREAARALARRLGEEERCA